MLDITKDIQSLTTLQIPYLTRPDPGIFRCDS
jgi:hypothetical protein